MERDCHRPVLPSSYGIHYAARVLRRLWGIALQAVDRLGFKGDGERNRFPGFVVGQNPMAPLAFARHDRPHTQRPAASCSDHVVSRPYQTPQSGKKHGLSRIGRSCVIVGI